LRKGGNSLVREEDGGRMKMPSVNIFIPISESASTGWNSFKMVKIGFLGTPTWSNVAQGVAERSLFLTMPGVGPRGPETKKSNPYHR